MPPGRRLKLRKFGYIIEDDVSCIGDCCYDYVTIYDGKDTSANTTATLCGKGTQEEIISTGGNLFIKFESDKAITKSGFQINYAIINA